MIEWNYCPECAQKLDTSGEFPTCPDGHFTKYPNPVAGTLCFIRYGSKYLILRRGREPKKGWWALPGGFVNYGETAEETIVREIEEETGLKPKELKFIGTFPNRYGDDGEHGLVVGFKCETDTDEVSLSSENSEYSWMELDDIPEMSFSDCNDALKQLKNSRT